MQNKEKIINYYEPNFLGKIIANDISSPIESKDYMYYENLYKENNNILKNTINFIDYERKNNKKRKRNNFEYNNILKIRCYKCKKDVSKLMVTGQLHLHCCYKIKK